MIAGFGCHENSTNDDGGDVDGCGECDWVVRGEFVDDAHGGNSTPNAGWEKNAFDGDVRERFRLVVVDGQEDEMREVL